MYHGKFLDDKKALSFYALNDFGTLYLVKGHSRTQLSVEPADTLDITFANNNNFSLRLEVMAFETIAQAKLKISNELKVQIATIRILYHGQLLEDERSFFDYEIADNSKLYTLFVDEERASKEN